MGHIVGPVLNQATPIGVTSRTHEDSKGEAQHPLSQAEWTLLAVFVQEGVEAYSAKTPNAMSRESWAAILDAFLPSARRRCPPRRTMRRGRRFARAPGIGATHNPGVLSGQSPLWRGAAGDGSDKASSVSRDTTRLIPRLPSKEPAT